MEVIMMSNKFILPLQKNFEIPVIRLNEPFDLTVAFTSNLDTKRVFTFRNGSKTD